MPEENEGVKPDSSSPAESVDEKGVPWKNRAMEQERKNADAQLRLEEYESRLAELEETASKTKAGSAQPTPDQVNAKLGEFVKDPDAYIDRKVKEREFQDQLLKVVPWLKNQEGFVEEDKLRLLQIEREHSLGGAPLQVAKTAWSLLQTEKLAAKLKSLSADTSREKTLSETQIEGTGKSVPSTEGKLTRKDVLAKMANTQNWNDYAKYVDMLEDIRE